VGTLISQGWSWSPLVERQGPLNLLLWSEAFDNAVWGKARSYIAANCAANPDTSLYTVDKLVEDGTASSTHPTTQTVSAGTSIKTLSIYLKAGGRQWAAIGMNNAPGTAYFDLVNGVVGTVDGSFSATITPIGSGWYRCSLSGNQKTTEFGCIIYPATEDAGRTYSGLGHQGTAAAGGSTTTAVLAAGASATDSVYNATEIIFSDAPTTIHTVSGYVGATLTATFTPARTAVPDATTYTVGPGIYIARAQLNPGTTLFPYRVTTG
jgi:hypothetical protein